MGEARGTVGFRGRGGKGVNASTSVPEPWDSKVEVLAPQTPGKKPETRPLRVDPLRIYRAVGKDTCLRSTTLVSLLRIESVDRESVRRPVRVLQDKILPSACQILLPHVACCKATFTT